MEKIYLFDGKSLDNWKTRSGDPAKWIVDEEGALAVVPGTGDIVCDETFGDAHLHVEFWLPNMPNASGQGKANSGVFVHGCYEVQVLDSYGKENLGDSECGAIYGQYKPLCNANLPPETWQTYDIYIRAPKFDDENNVTEDGSITVIFNGICVQNNSILRKHSSGSVTGNRVSEGPLLLQDHGNNIRFRNIWVQKLDRDSDK